MDNYTNYTFNPYAVVDTIETHWKEFANKLGVNKFILGISGGIDSTCVTALACKIFGRENVYGISMPCDEQHDIVDVIHVFQHFGINRLDFNIGEVNHAILTGIENNAIAVTAQTKTNLPARLRMATVYAFAQSLNALVLNTCNLSETLMGYDTLWGDDCGSYAPIQELTKTEVRQIAEYLGVPNDLVNKTPIDGLQGNTDEENFGFTYAELDAYIRSGIITGNVPKMIARNKASKFKMEMIHLTGPKFGFPNTFND